MTTTPRAPHPRPATRLTARTPEDLLAVVPVVLGFVPERSVVMLTFGARRAFHARVDLPATRGEIPDVVAALLGPAFRHRVPRVVFVLYAPEPGLAKAVCHALVRSFGEAGVEVVDVLRSDAGRWFPLLSGRRAVPAWGVPYDVSAHPFAAQSVLDGQVTHASRGDLAASLEPVAERVQAVTAALSRLPRRGRRTAGEEAWARSLVRRHLTDGCSPSDEDAARLLVGVAGETVRDAVWALMSRDGARDHVAFWTDLVRRCPDALVAPPAALLAFAAWLAGQGALAWCAVDRCVAADPGYRLAEHVGQALHHAVPPEVWESDWGDGCGGGWGEGWDEAARDDPA